MPLNYQHLYEVTIMYSKLPKNSKATWIKREDLHLLKKKIVKCGAIGGCIVIHWFTTTDGMLYFMH